MAGPGKRKPKQSQIMKVTVHVVEFLALFLLFAFPALLPKFC
jgi:hypothetical protein